MDVTYRSEKVCEAAGISYRQLDHWSHNGVLENYSPGSGQVRNYSRDETLRVMIVAALVRFGMSPAASGEIARSWASGLLSSYRAPVIIQVNVLALENYLDTLTPVPVASEDEPLPRAQQSVDVLA